MLNFIIAGCPRSGTTLLATILRRHSLIMVPDETGLLYYGVGHQKYPLKFEMPRRSYSRVFLTTKVTPSARTLCYTDFMKKFIKHHSNDKPIFGEKTPRNWYYLDIIDKLSKDTKVIFIERDCLSVVNSYKKYKQKWFPFYRAPNILKLNLTLPFLVWQNSANMYEICRANKLKVYYDDLVTNPKETLIKITEFLNLEYESELISPPTQKINMSEFVVATPRDLRAHENLQKPISNNWNKKNDKLTQKDKNYINFLIMSHGQLRLPMLFQYKIGYILYLTAGKVLYETLMKIDKVYDYIRRLKG